MAHPLWLAVGPRVFIGEDYLQIFKSVAFWLHSLCGYWEGLDPINRFNNTSWMAVDTLTDRPKSVRNRCVIEGISGVFCVVTLLFGIFLWV